MKSRWYKPGCDPRDPVNTQRLLFHYTRTPIALEYIFPSMKLRMGSMSAMNDQRESAPWHMNVMANRPAEEYARLSAEIEEAVDRYLKSYARLVCFAQDQPDEHPEFPPDQYEREDIIKGWEHDRMWAQYADNHTGLCLFFDREKLDQRMREHFDQRGHLVHGRVTYADRRYRRYEENPRQLAFDPFDKYYLPEEDGTLEDYLKRFRAEWWPHLYFLKDPDWKSEQEYRYVWLADDDPETDAEYVSIEGCLTAICLGASFHKAYEVNVREVSERTGAQILRIWYPDRNIFIVPAWNDDRFENEIEVSLPPEPDSSK